MNCKHIRKHLFDYRDQRLSEKEKNSLEMHLQECSECASLLEHFDKSLENSFLNEQVSADNFFYTRVLGKLESQNSPVLHFPTGKFMPAFYITLLIIAILLGINFGSFDKNIFLKNNATESTIVVNEENDYIKLTTSDQIFDNQYLNLIENGNNKQTENH